MTLSLLFFVFLRLQGDMVVDVHDKEQFVAQNQLYDHQVTYDDALSWDENIKHYKKQLEIEDAERLAARSEREKELEAKREETERLKAEGKTEVNTNTSKKKLQAGEKQKNAERRAAAEKAERAARRERLGIKENEQPASQVGNRRYARGRAYVPDRYENPEHAEEATLAAALESEGAASIDESVEEEIIPSVNEEE